MTRSAMIGSYEQVSKVTMRLQLDSGSLSSCACGTKHRVARGNRRFSTTHKYLSVHDQHDKPPVRWLQRSSNGCTDYYYCLASVTTPS